MKVKKELVAKLKEEKETKELNKMKEKKEKVSKASKLLKEISLPSKGKRIEMSFLNIGFVNLYGFRVDKALGCGKNDCVIFLMSPCLISICQ